MSLSRFAFCFQHLSHAKAPSREEELDNHEDTMGTKSAGDGRSKSPFPLRDLRAVVVNEF